MHATDPTPIDLSPSRTVLVGTTPVLLLTYSPGDAATLECDTAELQTRLRDAGGAEIVAFVPDVLPQADLPDVLERGCGGLADHTLMAAVAPVTDAVKTVSDEVVVGTVDRSTLAWLRGPALVRSADLLPALDGVSDRTVRPLGAVLGSLDQKDVEGAIGRL